jgi:hypothetical protein
MSAEEMSIAKPMTTKTAPPIKDIKQQSISSTVKRI